MSSFALVLCRLKSDTDPHPERERERERERSSCKRNSHISNLPLSLNARRFASLRRIRALHLVPAPGAMIRRSSRRRMRMPCSLCDLRCGTEGTTGRHFSANRLLYKCNRVISYTFFEVLRIYSSSSFISSASSLTCFLLKLVGNILKFHRRKIQFYSTGLRPTGPDTAIHIRNKGKDGKGGGELAFVHCLHVARASTAVAVAPT